MQNHENKKTNKDSEASPETMTALNNTLAVFIDACTPSDTSEFEDGFSMDTYESSIELPEGKGYLNLTGVTIKHDVHGIITKAMFTVSHGSADRGPGMSDDFRLIIDNPSVFANDGRGLSADDETFLFVDQKSIDARKQELVADPNFTPTSFTPRGIVMPSFNMTPAGDIYENGHEFNDQQNIGAIGLGMRFRFQNDEDLAKFQKSQAASDQARNEIGSTLTDERAERVMTLLAQVYPLLSGK